MRIRDILILFILLAAATSFVLYDSTPKQTRGRQENTVKPSSLPYPGGTVKDPAGSFSVLFLGDIHPVKRLGRDCFRYLKPLLKASDVVIANLEKPLASPSNNEKAFHLLKELGVGVLSLTSDHMLDNGRDGLENTLNILNSYGFRIIGAGFDEKTVESPLFLKGRVGSDDLEIAIVAALDQGHRPPTSVKPGPRLHWYDTKAMLEQLHEIERDHPSAFVVLYIQWGREWAWMHPRQRGIAKAMLDAGVDLIVGNGSHVIQQIQAGKKGTCLFGIGDFVKESSRLPRRVKNALPYGFAARLVFSPKGSGTRRVLRLYPFAYKYKAGSWYAAAPTAKDMGTILWHLVWKSWKICPRLKKRLVIRTDAFGRHFEIDLGRTGRTARKGGT